MKKTAIHFSSAANANRLVAGIPAAARAVQLLADSARLDAGDIAVLTTQSDWQPSRYCQAELARLAPGIEWEARDWQAETQCLETVSASTLFAHRFGLESVSEPALYPAASAAIIANTGKVTDGWISRYLNRPISQAMTRLLLHWPFIRPIHATAFAGLVGLAMALCLLAGNTAGLIAAAILFQCASIIDGVDGEIARATMRSSKLGATLDTACDAATNFAFIGGLALNLWWQGHFAAAKLGLAGLAVLMTGLAILGLQSVRAGRGLSFDAVKEDAHAKQSKLMILLAKLTSRDFYVFALALMVVTGLAPWAMIAFAMAAFAWFLFVSTKLLRRRLHANSPLLAERVLKP